MTTHPRVGFRSRPPSSRASQVLAAPETQETPLSVVVTHGNTRDAGMAIYPSLEDASFTHLTGPQKVAKRAQRRAARGSVVSY